MITLFINAPLNFDKTLHLGITGKTHADYDYLAKYENVYGYFKV